VQEQIGAAGGRACVHPSNLADMPSVDSLVAEVLAEHGHVDILVNNAGRSIRRSVELSYERARDFEGTINLNYLGPVRLTLGLLPAMRARGSGQLVNVSTVGIQVPAPRYSAYLASKAAFEVWLRCVAPEVRGDGVLATSVFLPLVRTPMSAPTRLYDFVPAATAGEAADLVCRAIVDRPRTVGPWWAKAGEVAYDVARGPFEAALAVAYRLTSDSAAARGDGSAREIEVPALAALARALRIG